MKKEMVSQRIRERLDQLDDGSFDRKKEEIQKFVAGDESQVDTLLTTWVLQNLMSYCYKKRSRTHGEKADNKKEKPCSFAAQRKGEEEVVLEQGKEEKKLMIRKEKKNTDKILKRKFEKDDDYQGEGGKGREVKKQIIENKAVKTLAEEGLDPPPAMPENLRRAIEEMGATNIDLVIMKRVFKTDTTQRHGRFSIPVNQKLCNFLTEQEERTLNQTIGSKHVPIAVKLIEPCLHVSDIHLKKWEMNTYSYMLTKRWYSVVERNQIEENDIMQLWSFRINGELWFQLIKVRDGGSSNEDGVLIEDFNGGISGHEHNSSGDGATTTTPSRDGDLGSSSHNSTISQHDELD